MRKNPFKTPPINEHKDFALYKLSFILKINLEILLGFRSDGIYLSSQKSKKKGLELLFATNEYDEYYLYYLFRINHELQFDVYSGPISGDLIALMKSFAENLNEPHKSHTVTLYSMISPTKLEYTLQGTKISIQSRRNGSVIKEFISSVDSKPLEREYTFFAFPPRFVDDDGTS